MARLFARDAALRGKLALTGEDVTKERVAVSMTNPYSYPTTKGVNVFGDVLVNMTADGVDLNLLWGEIHDALALYNEHRSAIVQLLSYPTVAVADVIPADHGWRMVRRSHRIRHASSNS